MSSELRPARGYSRPPFEAGNTAALRHGAYSPRVVDPIAQELVDAQLADPDLNYLKAPSYRPALWAWARAEARIQLLVESIARATTDGIGDLTDPAIKAAHTLLDRAESQAAKQRNALGLDPLARAKLGRDLVAAEVDYAQLLTAAREADKPQGTP